MIEFDLGVPGSGKTYKAVYALYSNFGINQKFKDSRFIHNDVDFAYTNINEIKLDSFNSGSVKTLDFDLFYSNLTILYNHYKDKKTDTELIEFAKEFDLFRCLIILDECQNFLDKNDKVLIWWLSYHRHLHHQIYLITQNLALVFTKYKSFTEFFYMAKPSSLRLFSSTMVYTQFTSSRLSQVSKSGVTKIPFIKEIFDSYHSGANQQSENIIKKFVLIAFICFLFLLIVIFLIKSYWLPSNDNKPTENLINSQIANQAINTYQNLENTQITEEPKQEELKLFKFNCFNNFCYYQFPDKSLFEIPQNILKTFLLDVENDKKFLSLKDKKLMIYVLVPETKFNFIKQGVTNENKNDNFTDVLSFSK